MVAKISATCLGSSAILRAVAPSLGAGIAAVLIAPAQQRNPSSLACALAETAARCAQRWSLGSALGAEPRTAGRGRSSFSSASTSLAVHSRSEPNPKTPASELQVAGSRLHAGSQASPDA